VAAVFEFLSVALVGGEVALIGDSVSVVCVQVALIRGPLSRVGDPVPFVEGGFASVGDLVPFVGYGVTQVGQPVTLVWWLVAAGAGVLSGLGGAFSLGGGPGALDSVVGGVGQRNLSPEVGSAAVVGRDLATLLCMPT
jgi:hypothetical protein